MPCLVVNQGKTHVDMGERGSQPMSAEKSLYLDPYEGSRAVPCNADGIYLNTLTFQKLPLHVYDI